MIVFWLRASHPVVLDHDDVTALRFVRRTLLGLQGHDFIADFEVHDSDEETTWSYRPGSEDPGQMLQGLRDAVEAVVPASWKLTSGVTVD